MTRLTRNSLATQKQKNAGVKIPKGPMSREPIAIIGMGLRFPGNVNSPDELWKLLCAGTDAIIEVPIDRWDARAYYDPDPTKPGKSNSKWGGYINNIDQFDADFFGISPREAARIDPQHRMLLEVAYEAMQDAGQPPEKLAGSPVGVFIGLCASDYCNIQVCRSERHTISAYTNIGLGSSIAANRISHQFNFHGSSLCVDTACSSSLVSVYMGCHAIWNGECNLSFAGGVNSLLRPEANIGFSKASMLAPDGRCKSFDEKANGYVRAEGAAVVLLKSLSRALADGDPIYAVIRGVQVNQDGRTPGLALPNQVAQEMLLRDIYSKAGVAPESVHFVEAHGTGTPAGDPIEMNAIGSVLGRNRKRGHECIVGSIKSNIGHLEAGSGIAGLIKATLCVKHGMIPGNLHFETPNPNIRFKELRVRVPRTLEPWPTNGSQTRIAGVNSFGFGGTNAHAIIESGPRRNGKAPSGSASTPKPLILPVAARGSEALRSLAASYKTFLLDEKNAGIPLNDICYSAAMRREHGDYRLAVTGETRQQLAEQLDAFVAGETRLAMSSGRRTANSAEKAIFVFSGMGPQWWAMGRQLFEAEPVFRDVILRCDSLLRKLAGFSLKDELMATEERSQINENYVAQPAIFALQAGLAAMWRSWGIEPAAIVGHSVGEVAAAYAAGIYDLPEAVQIVYHRSRLQQRTAGQGGMLAVGLSAAAAKKLIAPHTGSVSIAAVNSAEDVTLSGDAAALKKIAASLDKKQIFCRFLQVTIPYHSVRMNPLKKELLESLRKIKPRQSTVPFYSTVTGNLLKGTELTAEYWWRNVRQPVLFEKAIGRLIKDDYRLFLEISPHPVLSGFITKALASTKKEGLVVSSLRRQEPEQTMMLSAWSALYTAGYPVDWNKQYPGGGHFVRLPSYPWQRERHWHESSNTRRDRIGILVHPLLGQLVESAYSAWSVELDRHRLPYLNDHRVQDGAIFPAAGYVEMALAAARVIFGPGPAMVEDLVLHRALVMRGSESVSVQLVREPGQPSFDVYSQSTNGTELSWVRHVSGKIRRAQDESSMRRELLDDIRKRCPLEIPKSDVYRYYHKAGMQYGPLFQGVEKLWYGEGEALGRIELPPDLKKESSEYLLHPVILDSSFHVLLGAALKEAQSGDRKQGAYVVTRINRIRFYGRPSDNLFVHARLVDFGNDYFTGDIVLMDEKGDLIGDVGALCARAIEGATEKVDNYLYEYQWKLQARSGQVSEDSTDYIPAPSKMAKRLQPEGERLYKEFGLEDFETVDSEARTLTNAYFLNALQRIGWTARPGERFSANSLVAKLNIAPQHQRLISRELELLAEDGILLASDSQYEVSQMPKVEPVEELWRALWDRYPSQQAELLLLRQCGERLDEVLTGKLDPLELIFPQGSMTTADLYSNSPSFRIYNVLAQKAVALALEKLPQGKTVRILEIGGGTGGMTAYVLRKLQADRTEYVFSDITSVFTTHAEQKFADFPFVRYKVLDIENDPIAQGYEPHSFDLILSSDAVHATRDLSEALGNIKRLLKSNGLLILLEVNKAPRWILLVFGLLKGWWRFTDTDVRPSDPWIPVDQWKNLLEKVGFSKVACVTDTVPEKALHSLILAQGPAVEKEVKAPAVPSVPEGKAGKWIIFADGDGIGEDLARRLKARGECPVIIYPGKAFRSTAVDCYQINAKDPSDMQQVIQTALAGKMECRGIIHLWSLDTKETTKLEMVDAAQTRGCLSVLKAFQVLCRIRWTAVPRFWIVTSAVHDPTAVAKSLAVSQAPIWGIRRTLVNEYAELRCSVVDISRAPAPEEIQSLLDELLIDDKEDELVLRGYTRYVHRLMRVSSVKIQETIQQVTSTESSLPFAVEIPTPGILDNLTLRRKDRPKPGPNQVEIKVYAAALNFKDVIITMGLLPDEALGPTGRALGFECAGVISAVGEKVKAFKVGDPVIASGGGALSSHLLIDADWVWRKPAHVNFEEAATIPIAFATAYYSLHHVGRLQKGERVLIHAAAGGVGLAAIQVAHAAGAEVFATAGTPAKRALLRALGARHVSDSRSLFFAEEILAATGGEGVDVVLNSLAGDAIAKSFEVLRPYGRFVEIGKRDLYENNKIELRPFRNNLSFAAVALDHICAERPDHLRTLLREVIENVDRGLLRPLPYHVFPIENIKNAFRYMAQGKHIGKVVISMTNSEVVIAPPQRRKIAFRPDGTYLITGGLGGIGLVMAQWMVEHGARNLVLCGRSGASPQAQVAIDRMVQSKANVVVMKADVSSERDVAGILAEIARTMPPLSGVIHAAMVLDDALMHELDDRRMWNAMAPKINGAWNLHTQTLHLPLEMFMMFSSFSAVIGVSKQANYVAGNAFLDALAHHRRALGLPGLTVNLGAVGGAGYVAEKHHLGRKLDYFGIDLLPVQQMLNIVGMLLQEKAVQITAGCFDWQQMAKVNMLGDSPRFTYLVKPFLAGVGGTGVRLIDVLMAADSTERRKLLEKHLCEQMGRVLGASPTKIDIEKPLIAMGLDSLMAVEIGNRMQSELGVSVPPVKFMEGISISALAQYLVEQMEGSRSRTGTGPAADTRTHSRKSTSVESAGSRKSDQATDSKRSDEKAGTVATASANLKSRNRIKVMVDNLSDQEADALLTGLAKEDEMEQEA